MQLTEMKMAQVRPGVPLCKGTYSRGGDIGHRQ